MPEKPKRERGSRLKAISEGVSMPQSTVSSDSNNSNGLVLSRHDRKQRRRRMKCQSEGVSSMRLSLDTPNLPSSHVGEIINRQPQRLEALSELANLPTEVSIHCIYHFIMCLHSTNSLGIAGIA